MGGGTVLFEGTKKDVWDLTCQGCWLDTQETEDVPLVAVQGEKCGTLTTKKVSGEQDPHQQELASGGAWVQKPGREGSQACWGWKVTACPPQCDPHGHVPHSVSPASVTPQCVPHRETPQRVPATCPPRMSPCVPPTVPPTVLLRLLAAGAGRHALLGSPVALPQETQEPSPTAASPPSSPLLHLHFWGALCKPLLPGVVWGSPA